MRSARGQASLEYVAVVAVVAVVLALAGTAVAAPGVANAFGRALRHALCVATGGGCAADAPQACTMRSAQTKGSVTANVVLVKVGGELGLLREEKSDGTVDLTLLEHAGAGIEGGLGVGGRVELGSLDIAAGGELQARLVARLGGGRTWTVRGTKAADALQGRLTEVLAGEVLSAAGGPVADLAQKLAGRGAHRAVPRPSRETASVEVEGGLSGSLGPLSADAAAVVGVRRERRTGERTVYVDLEGDAGAVLAAVAGGGVSGRASLAITSARDGALRTLVVSASGAAGGRLGLPEEVGGQALGDRGVRLQGSAALDLSEPANAALVERLLAAARPGRVGALASAARALAVALRDGGRMDVAAYTTDRDAYGGALEAALGIKGGVSAELERTGSRLRRAWTRPPGGVWERRLDCAA